MVKPNSCDEEALYGIRRDSEALSGSMYHDLPFVDSLGNPELMREIVLCTLHTTRHSVAPMDFFVMSPNCKKVDVTIRGMSQA